MSFTDTVKQVADLAGAAADAWDRFLRARHPRYPIVGPEGEYEGPPPEEVATLRARLESLPPDELFKLAAVAELGRHQYPVAEFPGLWRDRAAAGAGPVIEDLLARGFLAADLLDGLGRLAGAGTNVEATLSAVV